MVIQVYAPTSNAEEAEAERFYEDLQDLLELTPQKDVLFIIRDWILGKSMLNNLRIKAPLSYGHSANLFFLGPHSLFPPSPPNSLV